METTTETTKIVSKPGCPQCGKGPRFCTKTGPVYRRKTKENPRTKVQAYVCTECGYKGRGNMFHMTEEMGIEKERSAEISPKMEPVVSDDSR
jgi:glutaredoxin